MKELQRKEEGSDVMEKTTVDSWEYNIVSGWCCPRCSKFHTSKDSMMECYNRCKLRYPMMGGFNPSLETFDKEVRFQCAHCKKRTFLYKIDLIRHIEVSCGYVKVLNKEAVK